MGSQLIYFILNSMFHIGSYESTAKFRMCNHVLQQTHRPASQGLTSESSSRKPALFIFFTHLQLLFCHIISHKILDRMYALFHWLFLHPNQFQKKKLYIYVYFFNQDKGRNCRFICRYCNSRCLQLFRIPKYYNPHLHGSSPWVWEILNLLYFMMAHSESAKAIERSP